MKIYLLATRAKMIARYLLWLLKIAVESVLPRKRRSLYKQDKPVTASFLQKYAKPKTFLNVSLPGKNVTLCSCLPYHEPAVKHAIWNFKYYLKQQETFACAEILHDEIASHLSESHLVPCPAYIIYVPSSSHHAGAKDFDHMKELSFILQCLSSTYIVLQDALEIQESASKEAQHTGTRADRKKWSDNKFRLSQEARQIFASHKPAYIVCIDDVLTTGSTFAAAAGTLREAADCPIACIALCHR